MTRKEIEDKLYEDRMRLRSIEANFTRIEPYSPAFDAMMQKAKELKAEIDALVIDELTIKREEFIGK